MEECPADTSATRHRGQPITIVELADLAGVSRSTMTLRLTRDGMSPAHAVRIGTARRSDPVLKPTTYRLNGLDHSASVLARIAGCGVSAMRNRLRSGYSAAQAVAMGDKAPLGGAPRYRLNGRPVSASVLAQMAGCPVPTMHQRLQRLSPADAVAMGPASFRRRSKSAASR